MLVKSRAYERTKPEEFTYDDLLTSAGIWNVLDPQDAAHAVRDFAVQLAEWQRVPSLLHGRNAQTLPRKRKPVGRWNIRHWTKTDSAGLVPRTGSGSISWRRHWLTEHRALVESCWAKRWRSLTLRRVVSLHAAVVRIFRGARHDQLSQLMSSEAGSASSTSDRIITEICLRGHGNWSGHAIVTRALGDAAVSTTMIGAAHTMMVGHVPRHRIVRTVAVRVRVHATVGWFDHAGHSTMVRCVERLNLSRSRADRLGLLVGVYGIAHAGDSPIARSIERLNVCDAAPVRLRSQTLLRRAIRVCPASMANVAAVVRTDKCLRWSLRKGVGKIFETCAETTARTVRLSVARLTVLCMRRSVHRGSAVSVHNGIVSMIVSLRRGATRRSTRIMCRGT